MKIEKRLIKDLKPAEYNPRQATKDQEKHLKASLEKFGVVEPIIVNSNPEREGVIVGGHFRVRELKKLKYKEVDCVIVDLSLQDERELNIRLNANTGSFDFDILANEFELPDLEEWGMSLPEMEIEELEPEETDGDDDIPEAVPAITIKGDLYELGSHRVLCGDSTMIDDVEKLMGGEKADMVFTDPPYNVASDSTNFAADKSKAMDDLKNSEWDKDFNIEDALAVLPMVRAEDCTYYIWTSHYLAGRIWDFFKDANHSSYLVWSKPNPMPSLSKRHPTWNTELCCYFSYGSKRVVNFPKEGHFLSCREVIKKSDGSHPTQKPIELISPIVLFNSNKGQLIYDAFLGSGSTLIACEQTNRKCYGMELDEKYCDVIVKRYITFCKKNNKPVSVKRNGEDCLNEFKK